VSSLSNVDIVFVDAQQAALRHDDQYLEQVAKPDMRKIFPVCTDLKEEDCRKLGLRAFEHVDKLRRLQAGQGKVISIYRLMDELGIKPVKRP
jgi:hypothetical protein